MNAQGNNDDLEIERLEIIKRYFSRIYTVLPEEMRTRLLKLDISKDELKSILKRIAFLPKKKQQDFLEELINHYPEKEDK
ncbi:MAG: hypothetical protein BAJALOKI1v1_2120002 [Promethearchaeota archaeon]|nr:MAG: hypothetical protein BAJALOKI1v1_2120002 [Candidatus Lokiarchaeota archaeon]